MRVEVYWNVRRRLYSVRALEGSGRGRVAWRTGEVALAGATFHVGEAGRERVRRERQKNVHAVVRGDVGVGPEFSVARLLRRREVDPSNPRRVAALVDSAVRVSYDPYVDD